MSYRVVKDEASLIDLSFATDWEGESEQHGRRTRLEVTVLSGGGQGLRVTAWHGDQDGARALLRERLEGLREAIEKELAEL